MTNISEGMYIFTIELFSGVEQKIKWIKGL